MIKIRIQFYRILKPGRKLVIDIPNLGTDEFEEKINKYFIISKKVEEGSMIQYFLIRIV